MLGRKRKSAPPETEAAGAEAAEAAEAEVAEALGAAPVGGQPAGPGPRDVSEVDPAASYIDLGSLLLQPHEGLEVRLQVDEQSGSVMAVLMVGAGGESVVEMRAFAASRNGDLWADARAEIAADTERRGGTAVEQDGPFGLELSCQIPVTGPEGEDLMQPSRVIGWNGRRWFLRATIAGRAALESEHAGPFEAAVRGVAVRRGDEAMAPGEALPLTLPPEARPMAE